jgi:transposase-like protein
MPLPNRTGPDGGSGPAPENTRQLRALGAAPSLEPAADKQLLTAAEAERLTTRINLKLGIIADNYEAVMPLIRQAIDGKAHEALGYPSIGAYAAGRFGDSLTRLGVDMRRDVVRELTEAGMSTRAIAPILGVSKDTVHRDLARVSDETPPQPDRRESHDSPAQPGQQAVRDLTPEPSTTITDAAETITGEVLPPPPPKVTGLDGKEYAHRQAIARDEPDRKRRRRPLKDGFFDASRDIEKAIDRLGRLIEDDRFARNRADLAHYANLFGRSMDRLQAVIDQLEGHDGGAS